MAVKLGTIGAALAAVLAVAVAGPASAAGTGTFAQVNLVSDQPGAAALTDPELVKFELDTFWAYRGGADPLDWFAEFGDRYILIHQKDFPADALSAWDVEAKSPDDFILDQIDLDDRIVWACVQQIVDSRANPPETVEDVLDALENAGLVESVAALRGGRHDG